MNDSARFDRPVDHGGAGGRVQAFDKIRLFAVCCVILLHTVSGVADTMPYMAEMTAGQTLVYRCIKAYCACGVPLFLMISGALLLSPEKEMPLSVLFKKHLLRMVLVILIFGTLFSLAELCAAAGAFHPVMVAQALKAALTGNTWAHLWYPYLMIFIYLLTPLFRYFVRVSTRASQRLCLIVLFVLFSLVPAALRATGFIDLPAGFPVFGFYYLAGWYVYTYLRTSVRAAVPVLAVSAVLILAAHFVRDVVIILDYASPVIVAYAVSLFVRMAADERPCVPCARIAPYVFGMYVTHAVWINLLYKVLEMTPLLAGGYILLPVFFASTFVFALAASYTLRLIPWVRESVL